MTIPEDIGPEDIGGDADAAGRPTRGRVLRIGTRDWEGAGDAGLRWLDSALEAVQLLERNRDILDALTGDEPASIDELAERTDRPAPTLILTLKALQRLGLIILQPGPGKRSVPKRAVDRVEIVLDL